MPSSPASDYDPSNDSMVWLSKRGEEAHDASGSDESDDEVPRRTRSDSENEAHKVAYEWKQKTLMERLDFDLPEHPGPDCITVALCRITESLPWAEINPRNNSKVMHTFDWHLPTIIELGFDYFDVQLEASFSSAESLSLSPAGGGINVEAVYVQPEEDDAELISLWDKGPAEIDWVLRGLAIRHAKGKRDIIVIHAHW